MHTLTSLRSLLVALVFVTPAAAQSGLLDQDSPYGVGFAHQVGFNVLPNSLQWQQQARAGVTGQLEGITFALEETFVGATTNVRIRLGPGWNTSPVVFETPVVATSPFFQEYFVSTLAAGIFLSAGDIFVVEFQGNGGPGSQTFARGWYTNPPGVPIYPEPIFLNGPGCYSNCLSRFGFRTWMVGTDFASLCWGNGSAGLDCPCANAGFSQRGCNNSSNTFGARLAVNGDTAPDTIVLRATGELPTALTIFLQGNVQLGTPATFGDGLRCAGGTLVRLYVKSAIDGNAQAPEAGDPSISARSAALGDPIAAGEQRWYQAYYRDAVASFCPAPTGDTFNASNAIRVDW